MDGCIGMARKCCNRSVLKPKGGEVFIFQLGAKFYNSYIQYS